MECYVYILIDGPKFDPDAFQQAMLSPDLGEVTWARARAAPHWSHTRAEPGTRFPCYWKTQKIHVQAHEHIEDAIITLFARYAPHLEKAASEYSGEISVQAVYRYVEKDGPKSVYLGRECIAALVKFGADFDFDVY